jgi:hypothetical protein
LAGLRARVSSLDSGVLELTLVRPVSNPLEPDLEVGTIQIDLSSGDVTGEVPDVDAEMVEVVALAVTPGDIVQEQTTGLIAVVTGVSTDKTRLSVPGMTISTSNIRKVGHVDLGTLDDLA